jgi:hypothetical protein
VVALSLNLEKATLMSTVEKANIFSDGEDIGMVTNYKFFLDLITNDNYSNEETKKE